MKRYLAKPDQTLTEHSIQALNQALKVMRLHLRLIDNKSLQAIPKEVLFHDIGKVSEAFQKKLLGRSKHEQEDIASDEDRPVKRHELLSGATYRMLFPSDLLGALAVYSHHGSLHPEMFTKDHHAIADLEVESAFQQIIELASSVELDIEIDHKRLMGKLRALRAEAVLYDLFKITISDDTPINRDAYIQRKGLLYVSDWLASGKRDASNYYSNPKFTANSLWKCISNKSSLSPKWHSYQQDCSSKDGNVLLCAPTGSGKTEAALLWAAGRDSKLVYLLPTRVTTNAIYRRLKALFGDKHVALVHSQATQYHRQHLEYWDHSEHLLRKNLFYSVSVATIDQVLVSGFNIGYWELKEFNLTGADIVLDEIHVYEPFTIGLIISYLVHLCKLGCRLFIMSATLPSYLKSILSKAIPDMLFLEAQEFNAISRNAIICLEDEQRVCELATNYLRAGKKVLLVQNTIDRAVGCFHDMLNIIEQNGIETRVICYHSRFINKHRNTKEGIIQRWAKGNDPLLLVATQVVEVSLDIDFDVMITENAPIDALIQRMGRVNRKGAKDGTMVYVHPQSAVSQKIYDAEIMERSYTLLRSLSGQYLNQNDLDGLLEEVYRDVDLETDPNYIAGLQAASQIQKRCNQVFDFADQYSDAADAVTRQISYLKSPVIPMCYYQKVKNLAPSIRSDYQVDTPNYAIARLDKSNVLVEQGFMYCDLPYDTLIGLTISNDAISQSLDGLNDNNTGFKRQPEQRDYIF